MIKPPVQDVVQFLTEHIHNDIRRIAQITGYNDVEAQLIIHLVLVGILNNLGQHNSKFSVMHRIVINLSFTLIFVSFFVCSLQALSKIQPFKSGPSLKASLRVIYLLFILKSIEIGAERNESVLNTKPPIKFLVTALVSIKTVPKKL